MSHFSASIWELSSDQGWDKERMVLLTEWRGAVKCSHRRKWKSQPRINYCTDLCCMSWLPVSDG